MSTSGLQLESLKRIYRFIYGEEVEIYLDRSSYLIDFLSNFRKTIADLFPDTEVCLETQRDTEEPSYEQLLIVIRTKLPVKIVRPLRNQLEGELEEQMEEFFGSCANAVIINTEYIA